MRSMGIYRREKYLGGWNSNYVVVLLEFHYE
jgi:hypothetical protein